MKQRIYITILLGTLLATSIMQAQDVNASRLRGNLMFDFRLSDLSSVSELSGFEISDFVGIGSQAGKQKALDRIKLFTGVVSVEEELASLEFCVLLKFGDAEGRSFFCEHVLGDRKISTKPTVHELSTREQPFWVGARIEGDKHLKVATKKFLAQKIADLPSDQCFRAWRSLPPHSFRLALDKTFLNQVGDRFKGLVTKDSPVIEELLSVLDETKHASFSMSLKDSTIFSASLKCRDGVSKSDYQSRINILLFAAKTSINSSFETKDFESGQISLAVAEVIKNLNAKIKDDSIVIRIPRPANAGMALRDLWMLVRQSYNSLSQLQNNE